MTELKEKLAAIIANAQGATLSNHHAVFEYLDGGDGDIQNKAIELIVEAHDAVIREILKDIKGVPALATHPEKYAPILRLICIAIEQKYLGGK